LKNTILGAAILAAIGAAAPALAQTTYGDVARVLSATPIAERASVPQRDCRPEPVTSYDERRYREAYREPREPAGIGAGTLLGAIAGGVIGHQFGGSTAGRDHGTVAGALIGGLVGNAAERDADAGYRTASREVYAERGPVTREVERCDTVSQSVERIVGYDVRYEYNGREFRTRLPYDPGPQMPVNVEVRPPAANTSISPRRPSYRGTY
jgi:uncharacterized protein YcfJ